MCPLFQAKDYANSLSGHHEGIVLSKQVSGTAPGAFLCRNNYHRLQTLVTARASKIISFFVRVTCKIVSLWNSWRGMTTSSNFIGSQITVRCNWTEFPFKKVNSQIAMHSVIQCHRVKPCLFLHAVWKIRFHAKHGVTSTGTLHRCARLETIANILRWNTAPLYHRQRPIALFIIFIMNQLVYLFLQ